jgi:CubicO group peptidase (beta-lactamase class C family)
MYQPGERWLYNTGSDVLGVLITRVSGKPLEAFLRERLFEPLGMRDTAFRVPAANLHRLHQEKPWNVPGRFGWDGGFGTSAYSDPKNDFIGILLTQRLMDSPEPPAVLEDFWRLAYQSLQEL